MKLSFTTAGCPGWSFNEIFATAHDLGIDGLEIRGIGEVMYAPDCSVFSADKIDATVAKLNDAKMEIIALDTTASLGVAQNSDSYMAEAKVYIDLAEKLACPFIRVMPTPKAEPMDADLELCKKQYNELCKYGEAHNVTPIMETNGVFCNSAILKDFLDSIESNNKGALWDIHHPYRYNGELPAETVKNLSNYILHTHVKDSVMAEEGVTYRMMGYGDIPVSDAVDALKSIDYNGYISLEWLKRWNPTLQEPGIVFAHFVSYMSYLLG